MLDLRCSAIFDTACICEVNSLITQAAAGPPTPILDIRVGKDLTAPRRRIVSFT